ncbi:hypothetical protein Pla175_28800 [Pirellulimonas nuda]|uniref:DUF4143 domain-containing protein n=1 Tax=Pirellulimonas nuda TaxID=2528009 RepID=A0A518DDD7_9BACT|nr:DUF4143 domain-containing protein [Pirellulimonas nuda]QDU89489.1 hypothetical protein Pla175_28800 [Pirellulimonas nuda]
MIDPSHRLARIDASLDSHAGLAVVGPWRAGKRDVVQRLSQDWGGLRVHWFDGLMPADVARLREPEATLGPLAGVVVLNEVSLSRELAGVVGRLLARRPCPARFVIVASTSACELGRIDDLAPGALAWEWYDGLACWEVGAENPQRLWLRGGLPGSYEAASDHESLRCRREVAALLLPRAADLMIDRSDITRLRSVWGQIALLHGDVWNASEIARRVRASDYAVGYDLTTLADAFAVRVLKAWRQLGVSKRQVSAPRVYVRDSGLLHAMLGIQTLEQLLEHGAAGASWRGFVIGQVIALLHAAPSESFYWRTHAGAELDLLIVRGQRRWGFAVQHAQRPRITRSMRRVMADLQLDRLHVVHAGAESLDLDERIRAVALADLHKEVAS